MAAIAGSARAKGAGTYGPHIKGDRSAMTDNKQPKGART